MPPRVVPCRSLPKPVVLALTALAVVALVLVANPRSAAAAAPFTVDDPVDAVDAVIDGTCATVTNTCTLRAAVQEANAAGGVTDVSFAPAADTSTLSLAGAGGAEVGDLDIASGVTLRLHGNVPAPDQSTLVKAASGDRHIHVLAGGRLEVVDVALAGGTTPGDGGAILNEGQVLITNSTTDQGGFSALFANTAGGVGGAVANGPGAVLSILNVSGSPSQSRVDVYGNTAAGGGGAIANQGGTVTLAGGTPGGVSHDVYVDTNSTPVDGGGVRNAKASTLTLGCRAYVRFSSADRGGDVYNAGELTMSGGTIDQGSATDGGGLFNDGPGTLTAQAPPAGCNQSAGSITRSAASGGGGGILNRGQVSVAAQAQLSVQGAGVPTNATTGGGILQEQGQVSIAGELFISDNRASLAGGGLAVTGGDVVTQPDGRLRLSTNRSSGDGGGAWISTGLLSAQALVDANQATGAGGGIALAGGPANLSLQGSAVLSNTADTGGGVAVASGTVNLLNTTIALNTAVAAGGGYHSAGGASTLRHVTVADNGPDGIWSSAALPVLQRALMARNNGQDCAGSGVTAGDFNVFDDATCSPSGSDLTDASRFGAVASFLDAVITDGKDSYSYGLQPGQPAIDFVDDAGCGTPDRDQVGTARPTDGGAGATGAQCDAGAIEAPYRGPVRTISGTVRNETSGAPMPGVCVFMGQINGNTDGSISVTDAEGAYTGDVPEGEFLMAFFLPKGGAVVPKDCDGNQIDKSVQPEWYRNVAVQFRPAPNEQEAIFPDIATVTKVVVSGGNTTGIDACLGAGPGAGLDAPCAPRAESTPTTTTTPPSAGNASASTAPGGSAAGGKGSSGGRRSAAAVPSRLASTGSSGAVVPWALALVLTGGWLLWLDRRRLRWSTA